MKSGPACLEMSILLKNEGDIGSDGIKTGKTSDEGM
jgi:hypothetical protein